MYLRSVLITALCLAVATAGCFNTGPKLGTVENTVTNQAAELQRCPSPVGTVALVEPAPRHWRSFNRSA